MTGNALQAACLEVVRRWESPDTEPEVAALALCGEAGEIANDVKKAVHYGVYTPAELRDKSRLEIRDVLWNLTNYATSQGLDLSEEMAATPGHIEAKMRLAAQKKKKKKRVPTACDTCPPNLLCAACPYKDQRKVFDRQRCA